MKYVHIYTGADNVSHFKDVDVEFNQGAMTENSNPMTAKNLMFGRQPGDLLLAWHPAPRRQFVFVLTGEMEIEASDGEIRRFGPGGVFLADDTTGKGHILRGISDGERIIALVPLPE